LVREPDDERYAISVKNAYRIVAVIAGRGMPQILLK
jgi:hypothetical protein